MAKTTELTTASGRIGYAIERSGMTLQQLAERIGISHATLSQWQVGATNIANAKAHILQAFADEVGFELRWLLHGTGPAVSRYVLPSEVQRVAAALRVMEQRAPLQIEPMVRMIEAAADYTAKH